MLTVAYYILKVIICSGILYGYYLLALKNKIFHRWNRFYLLAAVFLSLAVPLIKINIGQYSGASQTQVIHLIQAVSTGDEFVYEYTKNNHNIHINATNVSVFIYTVISGLLLAFLIQTLIRINRLKYKYQLTIVEGINFINTDAKGTPFSFFNNIFWNNKIDLNTYAGKQIFQHEVVHVHEKHSYDKIFMNIVLIFFWCNPVFWIIRRELNMIHEFIADKKAVEDNDTGAFAAMILQATYPQQRFNITNNFFYSPLKRRLAMLTKNKNPKMNYLSRMLVLPLAALVFFAFTLKVKPLNNKGQYEGITIKGKNDTVPPAVDSSYVIITNKKRLSSFNDSIPKYYKGKKMKGAQGDKLNKTFIYYEDGSTDTISTTEAEKLRIIPPPPPPPPAVDRDDNKVFTKVEVDPSFPGGETAWQKYITKIMTANIDELAKENKSGTCRVRFIVDVDGSVRDVKVLSMQGTKLAEISENAIRKGPKWVPAKQNDRVVTAYREQPITFTISEN